MLVLKSCKRGFTLIEIIAVLLIIGILVAAGVPKYQKTMEVAKAQEAQTLLRLVYNANRMYVINNCPTGQDCYRRGNLGTTQRVECTPGTEANDLVTGNYVQALNSPIRAYVYCGAEASNPGATDYVAKAERRIGASPGTMNAAYNDWIYEIDENGVMTPLNGAPAPSQ